MKIVDFFAYATIGLNILLIFRLFGVPVLKGLRKRYFPRVIEVIEEGDHVLVDVSEIKFYEFRPSSAINYMEEGFGRINKNEMDGTEIFECIYAAGFKDDVTLQGEYQGVRLTFRTGNSDSIVRKVNLECPRCGTKTMFSDKRERFLCPFCEIS